MNESLQWERTFFPKRLFRHQIDIVVDYDDDNATHRIEVHFDAMAT